MNLLSNEASTLKAYLQSEHFSAKPSPDFCYCPEYGAEDLSCCSQSTSWDFEYGICWYRQLHFKTVVSLAGLRVLHQNVFWGSCCRLIQEQRGICFQREKKKEGKIKDWKVSNLSDLLT